jgi:hypothetical protein
MKKIVMTWTILAIVGLALIVSNCSKSEGSQFVGDWDAFTIEKSGNLYIITQNDTHKPFIYCPSGASYNQGKLDCGNGLSFGYDQKNDTLLMGLGLQSTILHRIK